MKLYLKAALLSATFAVAGVAYAAGPTGTGMPTTPPNDTTGTDSSTPPDRPTDTNTGTSGSTTGGSSTDTRSGGSSTDSNSNTGSDRSNMSSSHHRTSYSSSRHHGSSMHMASSRRYREQCSELREQWQDASMQHRHMRHYSSAKRMAMKGEHACKMRSSSAMRTGVMHLRSAIRRLGEKASI